MYFSYTYRISVSLILFPNLEDIGMITIYRMTILYMERKMDD